MKSQYMCPEAPKSYISTPPLVPSFRIYLNPQAIINKTVKIVSITTLVLQD